MDTNRRFGKRMLQARKEKGLNSRETFAKMVPMSREYVRLIEQDPPGRKISLEMAVKIAKALKLPLEYFTK